jgi:hypothetical protein
VTTAWVNDGAVPLTLNACLTYAANCDSRWWRRRFRLAVSPALPILDDFCHGLEVSAATCPSRCFPGRSRATDRTRPYSIATCVPHARPRSMNALLSVGPAAAQKREGGKSHRPVDDCAPIKHSSARARQGKKQSKAKYDGKSLRLA